MASARRTGTNENISTFGAAGSGRDYTSLSTWEADTDNNLPLATQSEALECYADAASFDPGGTVTIAGATVDPSYFRVIRAASGHEHGGDPASGIVFNFSQTTGHGFALSETYFHLHDVNVVTRSLNSATSYRGVLIDQPYTQLVGITSTSTNAGAGVGTPFYYSFVSDGFLIDCIAYNGESINFYNYYSYPVAYNCTSVNAGTYGFYAFTGAINTTNCLSDNSGTADFFQQSSTTSGDYNASSDGTAHGTTTYTVPATLSHIFTDSANDIYLLKRDVGFKPLGISGMDLSADATFAFDDDIVGTTITGLWPVGAHWPGTPSARRQGANENVSTFGGVGAGRDYTDLATWESDTDNNLVTSTTSEVVELYNDSSPYSISPLSIWGATCDAFYFRILRPVSGQQHLGDPASGVRLDNSTTSNPLINVIFEYNVHIHDLVLINSINEASGRAVIRLDSSYATPRVVGCLLSGSNAGAGTVSGISSPIVSHLIDCIAYELDGSGYILSVNTTAVYNCDAIDCGATGFLRSGVSAPVLKNCLGKGNATDDFSSSGWGATSSNNASSDTTAPGSSSRISQTFDFHDTLNDIYLITPDDAGAKEYGVDLSTDSVFAFRDDIRGEDWP